MRNQTKAIHIANKIEHQVRFGTYDINKMEELMSVSGRELRRQNAALARLFKDLTAIGYGSDEPINGADVVDLMQVHYDRIAPIVKPRSR